MVNISLSSIDIAVIIIVIFNLIIIYTFINGAMAYQKERFDKLEAWEEAFVKTVFFLIYFFIVFMDVIILYLAL